jgi:ribose 1,5-bisphosphokinase
MAGRLFYVVGASGVGKDSLIAYARERLADSERIVFAHRYITRVPQPGGENHIELTETEFAQRERLGLFAMIWESHGYRYGVGLEIDVWLERGLTVIVNGSRDYVSSARQRLGVKAPADVLRIDNDGTLEEAGERLVALLKA